MAISFHSPTSPFASLSLLPYNTSNSNGRVQLQGIRLPNRDLHLRWFRRVFALRNPFLVAFGRYVRSTFSCACEASRDPPAWNAGTCLYMAWTGFACLGLSINSIIWRNYAINWAPVYCDIWTRFMLGVHAGVPASSLCINRRLYYIATVRSASTSKDDVSLILRSDPILNPPTPFSVHRSAELS